MAGFRRSRRGARDRSPAAATAPDARDAESRASGPVGDVAAPRPRPSAVEYGLAMLAARSWPEKILRERIRARYSQEETDAGLERLRELRLVDDAAWAERYARDRFERLGKGRHRIRMELVTKGIDAATVDAAIERAVDGDDERAKAAAMLDAMRRRAGGRCPAAADPTARTHNGADAGVDAEPAGDAHPTDPHERRKAAEREKNRLFRRMLARGFPASVLRDLLDVS